MGVATTYRAVSASDFPDGLPSWLVVVLIVILASPGVFSKFAARLPGLFGAAGRWWQNREPTTASAIGAAKEIDRLSRDYDRLRASTERDRDEYLERLARLDDRVLAMETELEKEKRLRWSAFGYIQVLVMALLRVGAVVPEAPEELDGLL